MTLRIRVAELKDTKALLELNSYGLAAAGVPSDTDVYSGDLANDAAAYRTDGAVMLVGEDDGVVVAMGGLRALAPETCEVLRMRVAPNHQGRGYGKAMLSALELRARTLGYRTARLLTGPDQRPAVDLYRAAGYRDAERVDFDGLPGLYMIKEL